MMINKTEIRTKKKRYEKIKKGTTKERIKDKSENKR